MINDNLNSTKPIIIAAVLFVLYAGSAMAMMGGVMGSSSATHMDDTNHMTTQQKDYVHQQMNNPYMDGNAGNLQSKDDKP